jgi:flagellar protein FliO/FliZ
MIPASVILVGANTLPGGVGAINGEILEYLKVITILGCVVVFAFAGLRFWLPKLTGIRGTASGPMHVAWRLALEPRKMLYIVRAGSDYVLVAASDAGVQLLTSLDTGKIEAALRESSVKPAVGFEFASLMRPGGRSHRVKRSE